jgi:hypothetical protein
MAKILVAIDIPNYDRQEIEKMAAELGASVVPGLLFGKLTGNLDQTVVMVHDRYLPIKRSGGLRAYEYFGIKEES